LAIQLKTLQVQIDAIGGEYHAVTLLLSIRKEIQNNIKETEDQQSSINQSIL
jgi:hypothetical protein